MSLQLKIDGQPVSIDLRRFPAGETFLRLDAAAVEELPGAAVITLAFEDNNDLFNLALLVDAVRREFGDICIDLFMPYLPYARQDRVCSPGESLSVSVVADFINGLKFTSVQCLNIHSDVGVALLHKISHQDATFVFARLASMLDKSQTVLVSPDAGANKKVLAVAKQYGFPNVVRADKSRDVLSGKITGTVVYSEHVGDKDFLIVDDICDGGRTFIELAKELRNKTSGKVMLYVTHGIFSAGVEVFDGLVDKLYTSNPVGASGEAAVASGTVAVI